MGLVDIVDADRDGRDGLEAGVAGIVAHGDCSRRSAPTLMVQRALDGDHAGGGVDHIAAVGRNAAVHPAAAEIITKLAVGRARGVLVGRRDGADHGAGADILVDAKAVGSGKGRRVVLVADGDVEIALGDPAMAVVGAHAHGVRRIALMVEGAGLLGGIDGQHAGAADLEAAARILRQGCRSACRHRRRSRRAGRSRRRPRHVRRPTAFRRPRCRSGRDRR